MRNAEKDEIEMARRRDRMIETGFRLFAEHGIETVTMRDVADAAGLGIATLYRYFSSKLVFAAAIGARKWEEYYKEVNEEYARRGGEMMNALEELDFYLGSYIVLYREHRDMLRFHQNFNGYVMHERVPPDQLREYLTSVDLFIRKFHILYVKGQKDGTIRTDEPEQTMFNATMHIMLATCGRFAQGVMVGTGDPEDLTRELLILKRMILNHYTPKSG